MVRARVGTRRWLLDRACDEAYSRDPPDTLLGVSDQPAGHAGGPLIASPVPSARADRAPPGWRSQRPRAGSTLGKRPSKSVSRFHLLNRGGCADQGRVDVLRGENGRTTGRALPHHRAPGERSTTGSVGGTWCAMTVRCDRCGAGEQRVAEQEELEAAATYLGRLVHWRCATRDEHLVWLRRATRKTAETLARLDPRHGAAGRGVRRVLREPRPPRRARTRSRLTSRYRRGATGPSSPGGVREAPLPPAPTGATTTGTSAATIRSRRRPRRHRGSATNR